MVQPGRFAYISPVRLVGWVEFRETHQCLRPWWVSQDSTHPTEERSSMTRTMTFACLVALWNGVSLAADTAELAAQRTRLQMASVPQEPASVLAVRKQLKAEPAQPGAPQARDVTVVGQIGGMPNPWSDTHPDFPWFAGQASFFLVDEKVAAQFASHAKSHGGDHHCAFCQRLAAKNAHAIAVVNFVDEAGKILPIDARELLGLEEHQRIVLRGRAELLGGTMLVIHADGVHIRR